MRAAEVVRTVRRRADLSVRDLAEAADVAASTVHRIERGQMEPTVKILARITAAGGMRLRCEPEVDHGVSLAGLALGIHNDVANEDESWPVRRAAELVQRFWGADDAQRRRMIATEPPPTSDRHWDAFIGALGEWLAVRAGLAVPEWTQADGRRLDHGWWVTTMPAMRAWEYAGSPMSFKRRGVYIHRDSLRNV